MCLLEASLGLRSSGNPFSLCVGGDRRWPKVTIYKNYSLNFSTNFKEKFRQVFQKNFVKFTYPIDQRESPQKPANFQRIFGNHNFPESARGLNNFFGLQDQFEGKLNHQSNAEEFCAATQCIIETAVKVGTGFGFREFLEGVD